MESPMDPSKSWRGPEWEQLGDTLGAREDSPQGSSFLRQGERGTEVRFRFVAAERAQHRVSRLCTVIGVTRQGFYAWRHRELSARRVWDQQLKELILEAHQKSWHTYGVPRMHA